MRWKEKWRERERNQEDDDWRGHAQEGRQKVEEVEPSSLVIVASQVQRFDVLEKPPLCLDLKPESEEEKEKKTKTMEREEKEEKQEKRFEEGEGRGLRLRLL